MTKKTTDDEDATNPDEVAETSIRSEVGHYATADDVLAFSQSV